MLKLEIQCDSRHDRRFIEGTCMVQSGHPDLWVENKHGKVESDQNFQGGESKGFFFFFTFFKKQFLCPMPK